MKKVKKLYRFSKIYGLKRSMVKASGRLRAYNVNYMKFISILPKKKSVSFIGAGQFAFSTIAFFLHKNFGNIFLECFDINLKNSNSLKSFYGFNGVSDNIKKLLENRHLKILYIASNHNSHTEYAIEALKRGIKNIYIEKPLSTSYKQFVSLSYYIYRYSDSNVFVGYNRPFSSAVLKIKEIMDEKINDSPFSIQYFISAHNIPKGHWYRNENEGTRIAGNMGHWIDLTIHMFFWRRNLPKFIKINIVYSDITEADDNLIVNFTTDRKDLISIFMTSRTEPFEGINETINLQISDIIAKIDDFRRLFIWKDDLFIEKKYFPKDVGHEKSVLQPFSNNYKRNWKEVELSTLLMLKIVDMVKAGKTDYVFYIKEEKDKFKKDISNYDLFKGE